MLDVSEKYREMAESDAREVSVKVEIGNYAVLTNDDIIELNIYRSMGESGFSIGGVVTAQIRLLALMELPYTGEVTIDVFVGFGFDEENASEFVQLGRFYGYATNPSFDTAQVEIIGYDKLGSGSFNSRCSFSAAGDAELTFPCTAQEMLEYVCERKNLETEFQCLDYIVSEMPVRDESKDDSDYERYYTYKDILSFIAAAHGAIAAMNNENKLVFLSVGEETETVDSADCVDFAFKSVEEFTVKGILLHVQDVLSTGSTNIFINDNSKIAYDGETTDGVVEASCPFGSIEIAEELWQQLGGFSYYSCEFTRRGRGWTELGDVIYAVDSLSGKTLLKHSGKMIAQTVEWKFSAAEGFMEHIISKAESPEESTERLGSVNSINNGSGSKDNNTEIIKFVRDNVEYGTVGIHEVGGETGVALSITDASKWLALVDENGEKILEYVPNREDSLWFLPVKSRDVPSFKGIYYSNPFTSVVSSGNVSELPYSVLNSTIFCFGSEETNKIKNMGFKNAVDSTIFDGDTWEVNGMTCTVEAFINRGGGQAGFFTGIRLTFDTFSIGYSMSLGFSKPSENRFGLVFTIPSFENYKNDELIGYYDPTIKFSFGDYDGTYYKVSGLTTFYNLTDEAYVRFWKDIIEAPSEVPKNTVRIYKNLVLMNGAKILNEDGSEYFS